VAIELMAAAQGIDFRKGVMGAETALGKGTAPVYQLIRERVPFIEQDTVMYPYLEAMRQLVASGQIAAATDEIIR
jgi:histidine ammonia-lyase